MDERAVLTTAEVAALFRVDPKTVIRWAEAGKFPQPIRTPGRSYRWFEDEVMAAREQFTHMVSEDGIHFRPAETSEDSRGV